MKIAKKTFVAELNRAIVASLATRKVEFGAGDAIVAAFPVVGEVRVRAAYASSRVATLVTVVLPSGKVLRFQKREMAEILFDRALRPGAAELAEESDEAILAGRASILFGDEHAKFLRARRAA